MNATAAALLGLLQRGPLTGYAVAHLAAAEFGNFWSVTRSQVYRELAAMADRGLVQVQATGVRDQRPHGITPAGRAAFHDWLHGELDPDTVRIPLLLRLAFVEQLEPTRLAELLEEQRARHERQLGGYLDLERALVDADVDRQQLLTLRFGIRYEQAVLAWLADITPGAEA